MLKKIKESFLAGIYLIVYEIILLWLEKKKEE